MSKSVFISRELNDSSPFRGMLEEKGFSVNGNSLINIKPVSFDTVPNVNWIFFYSKNGVKYFFSQLTDKQKAELPRQLATLGPATAEALKSYGYAPTFIGNGDPDDTAEMFVEIALGQHVLFPQATRSRQSVQSLLEEHILPISLIVYSNEPKPDPPKRTEDILVFTSPLNAEVYFGYHRIEPDQKLIAIGKTTGSKLSELGFNLYSIPESPTEEALAKTVAQLL